MHRMGYGVAIISQAFGAADPYLNDKNLEYLTGSKDRDAVLLLAPNGVAINQWASQKTENVGRGETAHAVLFVRALSAREKVMDGETGGENTVKKAAGVDAVLDFDEFDSVIGLALMKTETLWVNIPTPRSLSKPLSDDLVRLNRIRERFLWLNIKNIASLIHEMRRIKEDYEIACLREAFKIHTEVFEKIMSSLKPGDNEAKGKAIWDYETGMRGANVSGSTLDNYANNIIVGAGKNTAIAHYMDNNRDIEDGDLVLIDSGVSVGGYSSDITRTFPASGAFTERQRELYGIALEAQKAAIATMRPGSTLRVAHEAVYDTWKKYGLERYGYGRCGHPVGLNIHDSNGWVSDDDLPFEPGAVVVIEPFLSVPEERIGIRIEDGVLITEDGCEVLPGPAKEIEDVEKLCRRST
jgi:Xaa-Pro aminopeptidase